MRPRQGTARKYKSSTDDEITKMIKFKKAHLDQLQKENAQIKNTMDVNKRKTNDVNPAVFKQLNNLYQQMKSFQVKKAFQSRRNVMVFKQLIEYLEQQQVKNRKEQDIKYSTLKATEEKLLKKNEHEAQQILIRQNEQIAKINILREHLQVSRSQRVVYSNMFKKLQKQIRIYEQQFKQLLLETALIEEKRISQVNLNVLLENKKKVIEKKISRIQLNHQNLQQLHSQSLQTHSKRIQKSKINHMSNNSYNSYKSYNSYSSRYSDQRTQKRHKQQKQHNLHQYQKLQLFLDTLVIQSECKDLDNLMSQFQSIQNNNLNMVKQIQQINAEIQKYEQNINIKRANKYKKIQEDQEFQTIHLQKQSESKLFSKQTQVKIFRRDLIRIADLFQIPYSDPIQINDLFSQIQKSLEGFVSVQNLHVSEFQEQQYAFMKKDTRRGEDHQNQIQYLIDRAQRYHESQKIYEKQCFEDQYCKQIIRVRRVTKNKK